MMHPLSSVFFILTDGNTIRIKQEEEMTPPSSHTTGRTVPVRQARALSPASFRFRLETDTLAVRLTVPPIRQVKDLHLQVNAPYRAHANKRPAFNGPFSFTVRKVISSKSFSPFWKAPWSSPCRNIFLRSDSRRSRRLHACPVSCVLSPKLQPFDRRHCTLRL